MKIKTSGKIFFITTIFAVAVFSLVATNFAVAAGLVPCGDTTDKMCTLCHLIVGIQGLITYGLEIAVFVALTALVIAGIIYIVSAGSESLMTMAKGFIANVLKGFAFVIISWLLINTVMLLLGVKFANFSPTSSWWKFECDDVSTDYTDPTKDDRANCTGSKPANAKACDGENPTVSTKITLVSLCSTHVKCAYTCKDGYNLSGGTCVAKDSRSKCTGDTPANATACDSENPSSDKTITLVEICAQGQCYYKCKDGYNKVGNTCVKKKTKGEACGYNGLGKCTDGYTNATGVVTCPGDLIRYKDNGTAAESCTGQTGLTSAVICCISASANLGTCSSRGTCYPGDYSGCTDPYDWVISPSPDCEYDAAKCCEDKSSAEGEACGRSLKGTCMKNTGYVACPSGYNAWSGGTVDCGGMDLKCCVKENESLGSCTGRDTKKTGTCYAGSTAGTDCPGAGETKDGEDCGFEGDGTGLSEYKCCVK